MWECQTKVGCSCREQQGLVPHKHSALIKAWADGAKIQFLNGQMKWIDLNSPNWSSAFYYRIKPTSKSLGQIAYEARYASYETWRWDSETEAAREHWERTAQAVLTAAKERE